MKLPVSRKIRFHARASRERTVGWVIPLCFMWSRFWTCAPRDGSLAEYTAVEARNLAPLAADIDHTVAAALPISGLTETAAAFARHRRSPGKTIIQVAHDLEGNERS
jgi:NADPH:quinone reductase-like Zn-dependent oxidoreductase